MSKGAKYVALRCPGNEGDPLCHYSRIREGLDVRWHHAGTEKERDKESQINVRMEQG